MLTGHPECVYSKISVKLQAVSFEQEGAKNPRLVVAIDTSFAAIGHNIY
jgi:hypothetical protein